MAIPFLAPLVAAGKGIAGALGGAKGLAAIGGTALGYMGQRDANKIGEEAAAQSAQQRAEQMALIREFGQKALEPLAPAYQRSQDIRQESANRALALAGSMFRPQLEQFREGNYMAQQRIAEAVPFRMSALLGTGSLGYMPQAQNVGGQLDYGVLDPLMNPEPMQFTPVPGGQGQATQQATQQAAAPVDQMQQAMLTFQSDGQIPL
ncbi:MAG: hypothetical protein CMP84_15855 [Gammaproteobacteria bacterium]|nr:hypothetical protein [Gammaproteobacteria bacterium]|tara:strand:- start:24573 stop:25190 length:618 start_codon:yes stop_codon:yes gene_type:complete